MVPIILLLFIIVICLIYWFGRETTAEKVDRLLDESAGVFDDKAEEALRQLENKDLEPKELVQRADIFRFNIMEDNITEADPELVGHMLEDYTNAVIGAAINHTIIDVPYLDLEIGGVENDYIAMQLAAFDNVLMENAPIIEENVKHNKKVEAVKNAATRVEAVENALKPEYRSDRQNVHDSNVNSDLGRTLDKLAMDKVDIDKCLKEVKAECEKQGAKRTRCLAAYNMMEKAIPISTYKSNEAFILAAVWNRTNHKNNKKVSKLMKEAVMNALYDCTENDTLVCINGRCSRLLNSLVLLDFDETVGAAMTLEAYKAQIYEETKELFDLALDRAKDGPDHMKQLAKSYEDTSVVPTEEAEEEFAAELKRDIDNMLDFYSDKLNAREMEKTRAECYEYALI